MTGFAALDQVSVTLLFPGAANKREGALPGLEAVQAVETVDVVVVESPAYPKTIEIVPKFREKNINAIIKPMIMAVLFRENVFFNKNIKKAQTKTCLSFEELL